MSFNSVLALPVHEPPPEMSAEPQRLGDLLIWSGESWRDCTRCPRGRCRALRCVDGRTACIPAPGIERFRVVWSDK